MQWRLFGLLVAVAVFPSSAAATPVLQMGRSGHVTVREDPFAGAGQTPRSELVSPARPANLGSARAAAAHNPTVSGVLRGLHRSHAITAAAARRYRAGWNAALATERRLSGTRSTELGAVIQNLRDVAARRLLTASRLPALFMTLERNRQWWTSGPLLASGQRVQFSGSQLLWEYYPGQGVELTMLGNFGKVDGLYAAGRGDYAQMRAMLGELIPLAALRGGALTWEYYFRFDGGTPPWVSAMSQGTAIEALTRAAASLGTSSGAAYYLGLAHRALRIFTRRPPLGVAVPAAHGTRYLQYSFAPAPGDDIINAFLQSLIGLYDYAQASGDRQAASLFAAGNREALAEVPQFDTGAWSLYQPGQEDSLSYHELVTGFLAQLCSRTRASVYCSTAAHFQAYLKTPPALTILTTRLHAHRLAAIRFRLSKISHVGIVVLHGSQTVFSTSASFPYGLHAFSLPALAHTGTYTVHLAATDLAGNFNRAIATVQVTR